MEVLRRYVRELIGGGSWPYQRGAAVYSAAATIFREGLGTYRTLNQLRHAPETGPAISVKFRGLDHPLWLRPGGHDVDTVISNIVREEYGQFRSASPPCTLIDAGAYIGDTSAYFLSRFSNLQVVALEPNPDTLAFTQRNLSAYGQRARVLPYALSASETTTYLAGEGTGARINVSSGVKVDTITIPRLLEMLPGGRASILKLDIEGAEDEIFLSKPETWLPKIDRIIVETHSPQITRNVLNALAANDWKADQYRNLWYCSPRN